MKVVWADSILRVALGDQNITLFNTTECIFTLANCVVFSYMLFILLCAVVFTFN